MNPLHRTLNVGWISSKADLKISSLNSLPDFWVRESGRKIDPATGVSKRSRKHSNRKTPSSKLLGSPNVWRGPTPRQTMSLMKVSNPTKTEENRLGCRELTQVAGLIFEAKIERYFLESFFRGRNYCPRTAFSGSNSRSILSNQVISW